MKKELSKKILSCFLSVTITAIALSPISQAATDVATTDPNTDLPWEHAPQLPNT
ncbi:MULTISPECIES: hypothetical protein [Cytobacillus]|uniref:hypothetical protein n=1 Tax=Cytobacillus TaxID=2675230 RepID=UPI001356E594|nr:hypothetical protein [Cytobacillus sp. AMY 15.2]KAF0815510.1 hypothetical protein KIS4809_5741 [Bacillus sp. ZZV12-4809]MCM3094211.1 hypothetical protein [Cytobacillus sp. AMY 15.2]